MTRGITKNNQLLVKNLQKNAVNEINFINMQFKKISSAYLSNQLFDKKPIKSLFIYLLWKAWVFFRCFKLGSCIELLLLLCTIRTRRNESKSDSIFLNLSVRGIMLTMLDAVANPCT